MAVTSPPPASIGVHLDSNTKMPMRTRSHASAPQPALDDQVHGEDINGIDDVDDRPAKRQKNAFEELMTVKPMSKKPPSSPRKPKSVTSTDYAIRHEDIHGRKVSPTYPIGDPSSATSFPGRAGLEAYLVQPETFPASRVVYHTPQWTLIKDMYPKASVHLLLMPRNLEITRLHAFEAFRDKAFLVAAQTEVQKATAIAAAELRRQFGSVSAQDSKRIEAMDALLEGPEDEIDESSLPEGRDWLADIKVGVHSHPSMSNIHIHILSRDMHSESMRKSNHYNSFTTGFLVTLEELASMSEREKQERYDESFIDRDLICWRCGRNFGRKYKKLREHIDQEWEEWRRE